jgi:hypothetical protein
VGFLYIVIEDSLVVIPVIPSSPNPSHPSYIALTGGPATFRSMPPHAYSVSMSSSPPVTPPTLVVKAAQVLLLVRAHPRRAIEDIG